MAGTSIFLTLFPLSGTRQGLSGSALLPQSTLSPLSIPSRQPLSRTSAPEKHGGKDFSLKPALGGVHPSTGPVSRQESQLLRSAPSSNEEEVPESGETFTQDANNPPFIRLFSTHALLFKQIERFSRHAHEAIRNGDTSSAADYYQKALPLLISITEESNGHPLYASLPTGHLHLLKTLAGVIHLRRSGAPEEGFSTITFDEKQGLSDEPWSISALLSVLENLEHELSDDPRESSARAIVHILQASLRIQSSQASEDPIDSQLATAVSRLKDARELLKASEGNQHYEILLSSHLLQLEALSHQLVSAHLRQHARERKHVRARLYTNIERCIDLLHDLNKERPDDPLTTELIERTSHHIADIARLLMRMQLGKPALRVARDCINHPLFQTSPAVNALVADPLFRNCLNSNQQVIRFPDLQEDAIAQGRNPQFEGIKAAIAHAHSRNIAQSAADGVLGAACGMALNALIFGDHLTLGALSGSMTFTMIHRFKNGLASEEARSAWSTGRSEQKPRDVAQGIGKLILQSALLAVTMSIPASLLSTGEEGLRVFGETISMATRMYASALSWEALHSIGDAFSHYVNTFFEAPAYSRPTLELFEQHEVLQFGFNRVIWPVLQCFKGATLLFYAYSLFSSRHSKRMQKLSIFFLPGAFLLSAELGMIIAGKEDFWPRVLRGILISTELVAAMSIVGLFRLSPKGNAAAADASSQKLTLPSLNRNAVRILDWTYPIAGVMAFNISAAIGGRMQGAFFAEHDFRLVAIQSIAIALGLLPFTLLVTGLSKGLFSVGQHAREAWHDHQGIRRYAHVLKSPVTAILSASYTENRVKRIFSFELLPAMLRTLFGWDSVLGQTLHSALNVLYVHPVSTATWPETSGTMWERRFLLTAQAQIRTEKEQGDTSRESVQEESMTGLELSPEAEHDVHAFMRLAGHRVSPFHPFMTFRRRTQKLTPLRSLLRGFQKPQFPHLINERTFSNVHAMIMDDVVDEQLSAQGLAALFSFIQNAADHHPSPDRDVASAWARMLALARHSPRWGEEITAFFEENPSIAHLMDLDLAKLTLPDNLSRAARRRFVERLVSKPLRVYEQECRLYEYGEAARALLSGLFQGGIEPISSPQHATPEMANVIQLSQKRPRNK